MISAIEQKANEITNTVSQTYATKTSVTYVSNNLKNKTSTTNTKITTIKKKTHSKINT